MLEFLTYLCSGVVCLVLGIVLLGVRTDYIDGEKDFRKVKSFVAYAAFLDVLKDILIILMQSYRADYFLANWFFVPFVLWLQMTMGACSLLAMFRSKEVCKSNLILFCLPIVLLMTTMCRGILSLPIRNFSELVCPMAYAGRCTRLPWWNWQRLGYGLSVT